MGPLLIPGLSVGVPIAAAWMLSYFTGRNRDFEKMRMYQEQVQSERKLNLKRGARAARKTADEGREAADQGIALFQAGKFIENITPTESYGGATAAQAEMAGEAMRLSGGPQAFVGEAPMAAEPDPRMASIAPLASQLASQYGTREFANQMWDYNAGQRPYANTWATLAGYPDDFTKGMA